MLVNISQFLCWLCWSLEWSQASENSQRLHTFEGLLMVPASFSNAHANSKLSYALFIHKDTFWVSISYVPLDFVVFPLHLTVCFQSTVLVTLALKRGCGNRTLSRIMLVFLSEWRNVSPSISLNNNWFGKSITFQLKFLHPSLKIAEWNKTLKNLNAYDSCFT